MSDIIKFDFSTSDSAMYSGFEFRMENKDGRYAVKVRPSYEEEFFCFDTGAEFAGKLNEIIEEYGVRKWNGFNKRRKYILDGSSFALHAEFSDGRVITASGYMRYPKNYVPAGDKIIALFEGEYRIRRPDYKTAAASLLALTDGVPHLTANLSNASALIFELLENINWAGFYIFDGGKLVLGPFQGRPACIEIAPGRGVCGTAFQRDETLIVPDVHEFPGHIACDPRSASEIVIPIHKNGAVRGVLDIDSQYKYRFSGYDADGLSELVRVIEGFI